MKILNLILFLLIVSLGTINSSTTEVTSESQGNYPNLISDKESNSMNNNGVNMPFPPEDANSDGIVDADDLAISIVEKDNYCSENCLADVDGNGYTDLTDVVIIYNYILTYLNQ